MYLLNQSYVIKKTILDEEYLFNKNSGEIFELNNTALFVLKNVINHDLNYVINCVCSNYEIENINDLKDDISEIIDEFCNIGIIEIQS